MWDLLSAQHSPADLIYLPLCMPHVMLYSIVGYHTQPIRSEKNIKRCSRFIKIGFCLIGVLPMGFRNSLPLLFDLLFLLCPGSFQTLGRSIQPLELPEVVRTLTPLTHSQPIAHSGHQSNHLADGVKQKIDVRGVMYVGLYNKAIATAF